MNRLFSTYWRVVDLSFRRRSRIHSNNWSFQELCPFIAHVAVFLHGLQPKPSGISGVVAGRYSIREKVGYQPMTYYTSKRQNDTSERKEHTLSCQRNGIKMEELRAFNWAKEANIRTWVMILPLLREGIIRAEETISCFHEQVL